MDILNLIFSALLLFQATDARDDCPFPSCGHNPFSVRFPFRLQNQQPESCGYPGFGLSCTSQTRHELLILNLPYWGDFYVRNINYFIQEIQLYDPNNCLPRRLLGLNLSSSPFMAGYVENFTFLSCPPDLVKGRFATIDCLSNSTSFVLATSSMNLVRALNVCSIMDTLPVPVSLPQDGDWLASDLSEDLRLVWNVPNCEGCEARRGICGFENETSDQVFCFDDDGRDKSRGLQIFKIIALSIVIPAVTCSLCISCFTCLMERRTARGSATSAVAPPPPSLPLDDAVIGLDESTIESYTKVVLGESRRLPGPNGATCPICLVDYHPKDIVRCIPECEHCFHTDCIDEWLRLNGTCPICRKSPSPARAS